MSPTTINDGEGGVGGREGEVKNEQYFSKSQIKYFSVLAF